MKMVKQLKLELSLKDKIHNLNDRKRKDLISNLYHNFYETNHEKRLWGEIPKYNKLWKYLKHNPNTFNFWLKEILDLKMEN